MRLLRISVWALAGGIGAVLLFLVLTRGDVLVVALLLLLGTALGTGLILDRVDNSRRPPEDRPADWQASPEDHWGFRGRPGS